MVSVGSLTSPLPQVARLLFDAFTSVPTYDVDTFVDMYHAQIADYRLVHHLSVITKAQLHLAEKMNLIAVKNVKGNSD